MLKTTIKSQVSRNVGFDTIAKKKVSEVETPIDEIVKETHESLPENVRLSTMHVDSV